jgi:hypothetical protein
VDLHRSFTIDQLPLIHISAVCDSAPLYSLQSVIVVKVTRICPMYSLQSVIVVQNQSIQ